MKKAIGQTVREL